MDNWVKGLITQLTGLFAEKAVEAVDGAVEKAGPKTARHDSKAITAADLSAKRKPA